jgi:replicative DNA helicase
VKRLLARGLAADVTTIPPELVANSKGSIGELEEYILELTSNKIPTISNVESYARIVANLARVRRARATLEELENVAPAECEEAIDRFEAAVMANGALKSRTGQALKTVGEIIPEVFADMESAAKAGRSFDGIATGLLELDALLCGLKDGQLVVLAGRPGTGKSAFASGVVLSAASAGLLSVVYSLEMQKNQWVIRMLSGHSGIDSKRLQNSRLTSAEWATLIRSGDDLHNLPLVINDSPDITALSLRAKCRRLLLERGKIGLVVVDYLQLMRSGLKRESREQDVAEISRSLKALARELQCPIISIAQLNRQCEMRVDKRPTLGDLRESGAIEQDADIVLMLYRDELYNDKPENRGLAEVIVTKNRMGSTGKITCRFTKELTRFDNLSRMADGDYRDTRFCD